MCLAILILLLDSSKGRKKLPDKRYFNATFVSSYLKGPSLYHQLIAAAICPFPSYIRFSIRMMRDSLYPHPWGILMRYGGHMLILLAVRLVTVCIRLSTVFYVVHRLLYAAILFHLLPLLPSSFNSVMDCICRCLVFLKIWQVSDFIFLTVTNDLLN